MLSASTFATHHIVVLDATAHLLDGFLQRTEAVGDADAEVAGTHIVEGLHAEGLVLGRAVHLDVFPERVVAREGDSELLLEETLVERNAGKVHGRAASLQTDTWGEVAAVQIDAEIFRERKLHPGEDTAADTAVLHPCLLAAEVFVVHTAVHEDAEELDGRIAGVEEEAGAVLAKEIRELKASSEKKKEEASDLVISLLVSF